MTIDLSECIYILSRTPEILDLWLREIPERLVHRNEGPDTWSPFDVVGHLIHGERTDWMTRLDIILEHGSDRPFQPFDRFAQFEVSKGKTIDELLNTFAGLRADNLSRLRAMKLDESALRKEGMHPELGSVTASQLLTTWAVHDLNHIGQIARTIARQYVTDVGPWVAYLPVLTDRQ